MIRRLKFRRSRNEPLKKQRNTTLRIVPHQLNSHTIIFSPFQLSLICNHLMNEMLGFNNAKAYKLSLERVPTFDEFKRSVKCSAVKKFPRRWQEVMTEREYYKT